MSRHSRLEMACQGADWTYSPRIRCLDFDWSVLSNDARLAGYVAYLYQPCVVGSPGPAPNVFIVRRHSNGEAPPVSLYRDDQPILRRVPADLAVARLAWEVNRGVVEGAGRRLLLHAAAAEQDGRIVILAGPEGSGKSTLVDALVRAGLRYVTDETVAVRLPSARIDPYPKPIALHESEQEELVPAHAIRADSVATSGGIARVLVLLAGYRPGRATTAEEMQRADAAVVLAEQAFNFRHLGRGRLDVLADVVRAADSYRLEVGELSAARDVVLDLVANGNPER
jgi:hypothetical protein